MKKIIEIACNNRLNPYPLKGILTCLFLTGLYTHIYSQKSPGTLPEHSPLEMDSILKQGHEYDLITPLAGTWSAIQISYSKDNKMVRRDTFKVERKMIGNFLQETMEPIVKNEGNAFTRISYLNYNRTNLRWEYIVLDTRFPIMMFETGPGPHLTGDSLSLYLDAFIMPPFLGKEYAGMLTKERRVVTFKSNDLTIHRQYWTLPANKEFLAIEYIFKRE